MERGAVTWWSCLLAAVPAVHDWEDEGPAASELCLVPPPRPATPRAQNCPSFGVCTLAQDRLNEQCLCLISLFPLFFCAFAVTGPSVHSGWLL